MSGHYDFLDLVIEIHAVYNYFELTKPNEHEYQEILQKIMYQIGLGCVETALYRLRAEEHNILQHVGRFETFWNYYWAIKKLERLVRV